MAGFFITFEGVDKSGKTTQAEALAARLRGDGRDVVFTHEPGGTALGEEIRRLALDRRTGAPIAPVAEMFLFAADRAQHVAELIQPALQAGKVVISDRFIDSTLAYQGYGRGLDLAQLRAVQEIAIGGGRPDLTVWVDVDPATARERRLAGPLDRFEVEDERFFARVRAGFEALCRAEPERLFRVDGREAVGALSDRIYAEARRRLKQKAAE